MSYLNKTLSEFLKELSAHTPVPGGGSAAALAGALGMGLLSMSAYFSIGKKTPRAKRREIKKLLRESRRLKDRFAQLVDEDVRNYLEVVKANRLVTYLPERRQSPFLEPSLRKALASALNICNNAHHGIHLSKILLEKGNPHLVSDVATAAALLNGSFTSARFLCEANLSALKNKRLHQKTDRLLSFQEKEIERLIAQLPRKVHALMRIERRHVR